MHGDWVFILGTGIFIVELLIGCNILLRKHEEQASALLWMFIIVIIPIVGIMLYFIFGINRFGKMNSRLTAIKREIDDDIAVHSREPKYHNLRENFCKFYAGDNCAEYAKMFKKMLCAQTSGNLPGTEEYCLMGGNHIELLEDGTAAYPAMLDAINNAKVSIRMQSFIINNDPIGKDFFDALERKAAEGVDVRVIYDGFGSFWASFHHFFQRYRDRKNKNLIIRSFDKLKLFSPWMIHQRNHRKLLVIDGKTAFVGGINISEANKQIKNTPKRKHIHDLHCKICGPAVAQFHLKFYRDWLFASHIKTTPRDIMLPNEFPTLEACGNANVGVVAGGPGQVPHATQKAFFIAAANAKKSIWIMTPYFVPSRSFLESLCMAVARGVEVVIIVPKNNNHPLVAWAAQSFYRQLLNGGVKIMLRDGDFSHAKAMLVDYAWAYMGSSNCDLRSFRANYELDFTVDDQNFIHQLHQQFIKEINNSQPVQAADVENKSTAKKLGENLAALLAPIL